jgi:hypothetical protein
MASNNPAAYSRATSTLKSSSYSAASTNGTTVDTKGYRHAVVVLNAGTAGAAATADVKLQSSADDSTWADVSGATFTQITVSNDNDIYVGFVNCEANDRYLRAVVDCASGTVALGVSIVLMQPEVGPAGQVNAAAFSK